jgi:hypothetical protein
MYGDHEYSRYFGGVYSCIIHMCVNSEKYVVRKLVEVRDKHYMVN